MTIAKTLISWYSVNKRDLPWRNTKNPYFIWLSEIILQQTQVKQGLPYYEAFVNEYPTVFDLANATENEVLKTWQGLGYYSRARNLHYTAKFVVEQLNGVFPGSYDELLKLTGVGDYTASAISSICFNESRAVVDGNVYRFLSRLYGEHTPINSTKGQKLFKALAQDLIPAKDPGEFNQAIMEFGARQCKPKGPDCHICPFFEQCIGAKNDQVKDLPVKLKLQKVKTVYFSFLVFIDKKRNTIIEQRTGSGIWENLYQFPLIESNTKISSEDVDQHIMERFKLNKGMYSILCFNPRPILHKLSHRHLITDFWIIELDALPVKGVSLYIIRDYPVPVLISNFIKDFDC